MSKEEQFGEIEYDGLDVEESEVALSALPKRIFLLFNFADPGDEIISEVLDGLIEDAEKRGLFFEAGGIVEMPIEDVVKGSGLHQAITASEHPL